MQRREFIQYSSAVIATALLPQVSYGKNEFTKMVKAAWYCSKLNPVRFVAGLVFDEVAEVLLKPLAKRAFHALVVAASSGVSSFASSNDWKPGSYSKNDNALYSPSIKHELYKGAIVTYGVTDFKVIKQQKEAQLKLQLKKEADIQRTQKVLEYLAKNNLEVKLYNSDKLLLVSENWEPTYLFNIEYIDWDNKDKQIKMIQELLQHADNRIFTSGELLV